MEYYPTTNWRIQNGIQHRVPTVLIPHFVTYFLRFFCLIACPNSVEIKTLNHSLADVLTSFQGKMGGSDSKFCK